MPHNPNYPRISEDPFKEIKIQDGGIRRSKTGRSEDCEDQTIDGFRAPVGVYGVLDGVGSKRGKDGSTIAASEINNRLQFYNGEKIFNIGARNSEQIKKDLVTAFSEANYRLRKYPPDRDGKVPATTATVLEFCTNSNLEPVAIIAHVGDSRAYLFRDGKLECLTLDDNEDIKKAKNPKEYQRELSNTHKHAFLETRHALSNALGSEKFRKPEIIEIKVYEGDAFLLTTDGITDNLTEQEIEKVIKGFFAIIKSEKRQSTTEDILDLCEQLQKRAWKVSQKEWLDEARAKPDDMTAIVISLNKKEAY